MPDSSTLWTAARQASLSITISQSSLKLTSIESVMPSNHLILCHPLLLLPSIFPSIRVFSNESVLYIRWPKDWSFSSSISPSNEYLGLICFRMDWLDLLAVQGTQESSPRPQFKSINSPLSQPLATTIYFLSLNPPLLHVSYMWDHTLYDLLQLASFTQPSVFKGRLYCGVSVSASFFSWLHNTLCGWTTFCLSIHQLCFFPPFGY